MSLWLTTRVALRALAKNRMRAALTVLGVIIGIAAVTTMVSIGQSATRLIQNEFQSLGTNVIIITPKVRRRGGVRQTATITLTAADSDAIAVECRGILASSPLVGTAGQVIYGNNNWSPRELFGVGADYLLVRNAQIKRGGFFTQRDIASAAKVCVIGQTIVSQLFQTSDPIGQTIRIRNIPFRVIGVLSEQGANLVGEDQDDLILMPYTTVRKRLNGSNFDNVHAIFASARSIGQMHDAEMEIRGLLADRHRIPPGAPLDFEVHNTTEIAKVFGIVTGTMTAMLASIAGISLIVGGVGIMNIMLVSVTERTREIGLRMAVGARGRDILKQFLIEAVILSCAGGIVGLALGISASVAITTVINHALSGADWPIVISVPAAAIAIIFSAAVGVGFGFFPALRASRLDPIVALRYE